MSFNFTKDVSLKRYAFLYLDDIVICGEFEKVLVLLVLFLVVTKLLFRATFNMQKKDVSKVIHQLGNLATKLE